MKNLTIQGRLTAWYLLSLAIIVALLAGGSWFAMQEHVPLHRPRSSLQNRIGVPFIGATRSIPGSSSESLSASSDSTIVGVFVQVIDEQSAILYESDVLRSHRVPVLLQGRPDASISISTVAGRAGRFAWQVNTWWS